MKTRAFAVLLVVLASVTALPAAPLDDRLPAGPIAYLGWAGRNLPFDGSMLGQFLNDPAAAHLLGLLQQAIAADVRDPCQHELFNHAWELAALAWQHPAAVALLDLPEPNSQTAPSLAMVVDLGNDRETFAKALDAVLAGIGWPAPLREETAGKTTYRCGKTPQGWTVSFGYLDNLFFATLGDNTPRTLLDLVPAKSLKADRRFADALAALGGENLQAAWFVDAAAVVKHLEPLADAARKTQAGSQPTFRQTLATLGLADVSVLAGTMQIVDRGLYSRTKLFLPITRKGVQALLTGSALTDADLAEIPDDADFALAFNLPLDASFAEFRKVLRELDPAAESKLDLGLAMVDQAIGASLEKDLLAGLDETWILSSAPSQGGFLTGSLLTVAVKDANRFAATLHAVENSLQGRFCTSQPASRPADDAGKIIIRTLRQDPAEIRYLQLVGKPAPVAPAWALYKGRLYLAPWPQVIQAAIENAGKAPLTKSAAFRQVQSRLAGKPSALCYVNTPHVLRQVYPLALLGWSAGANMLPVEKNLAARTDWLPPLTALERYFWPRISGLSTAADGIVFEEYGATPGLLPLLIAALLGAAGK